MKSVYRKENLWTNKNLKERSIMLSGFHWDLKRKATNKDRIEITRRKRDGEDIGKILMDMRLI